MKLDSSSSYRELSDLKIFSRKTYPFVGIKKQIDYLVKLGYYDSFEHFFEEAFKNGIVRFKPLIDKKRINGEIDEETYENLMQDIKRIAESENLGINVEIKKGNDVD